MLALLADSTNVERPGYTMSERAVGATFKRQFTGCDKRIIVTTFASNVHRIQQVLDEAEARARADKEAFVATGGQAEDFIPIIIDVDYEIKCQNGHYLSFILTKTETLANAYTEYYAYNIDLETGRELTLRDLLGPDWKLIANEAVRAGIDERSQDPANVYFDGSDGIEGFQSIRDDQPFYLNESGSPVVVFSKYEIAPGYMGMQEFEVGSLLPNDA